MKRSTRMLLMNANNRQDNREKSDRRYEVNYPRNEDGSFMESRRNRDSRGRFVRDQYGEEDGSMEMAYHNYPHPNIPPAYDKRRYEREEYRPMNKIGFAVDGEMQRIPSETDEENYQGMGRNREYRSENGQPYLSREMAMEWLQGMENEDGSMGPHWSFDQAKQVMAQKNLDCNPLEFWVAINATYSDLSKVFKKYGISNIDAYVDFATTFWLKDKDAVEDKLAAYYEYVVR